MTIDRFLFASLIALAFSLLLNAVAISQYLKQRDDLALSGAELDAAKNVSTIALAAADACSASMDDLRRASAVLMVERDAARAVAAGRAKAHNARADAMLAAPAPVPGDICASAAARFSAWQGGRKREGAAP